MAEQDPILVESVDTPESAESIILTPTVPPNRPRKVYGGMWGPLEIAAVAIGFMTLIGVGFLYFVLVLPSNQELAKNRSEADRLEAELVSARSKYGQITTTEAQVAKLLTSVDDFQTRFLPATTNGQTALYQRLNGLIRGYGLVNTSGPDYAPLEIADQNAEQTTDEERGRAKFRSLFPGVYVTVTLEGSYQNLRRFIREIEAGREFIIVSSVELAPSDSDGQKPQNTQTTPAIAGGMPGFNQPVVEPATQLPRPKGKMHGEVVSLQIEMAAYFRRPDFAPMAPVTGQ
ncbi:MAG TPA: GspMb/PilO family protein [Pyrinomonadaceae bacterium]|nr:GspMb/PilO family protein [Pyrinomonadaceae bacterium]